MTSPSSSNSNGQEPQLPPLLPPLRSTQHILQQLSVFPGAALLLTFTKKNCILNVELLFFFLKKTYLDVIFVFFATSII